MSIKHGVNCLLRIFGYHIVRFKPIAPFARIKRLFESYGIDTVIDVGANVGQFAHHLRKDIGYTKRILSFEPLSSAFKLLMANAQGDKNWEIFNFALGDKEEKREINIAGNSYSSSLLDMLPSHINAAPESKYIGREITEIKTLDSNFGRWCESSNNIYLKIDTQGFESKVLKGAEKSLAHIDTVQIEMSLMQMYKGELLFSEMYMLMGEKGFSLVSIESEFTDPVSGQLLQVNGIFHRFAPVIA